MLKLKLVLEIVFVFVFNYFLYKGWHKTHNNTSAVLECSESSGWCLQFQARQRELADNLQLRKKFQEIKSMTSQIAELETELGGFDIQNLERERRKLQQSQEKFKNEVGRGL